MSRQKKQLSSPIASGGAGYKFEAHVQASFVTLMLTGGYAPCLPCWPIVEIKPQGKIDGFDTDDVIIFVEKIDSKEKRKLLVQVKLSIGFTKGNTRLSEVIQAAWNDFQNPSKFSKGKDSIALITGPLNRADTENIVWLLDQAKRTKDSSEFFRHVGQANFASPKAAEKLEVFRYHLKNVNNNVDVSNEEIYAFLNHFHLLIYDLGKEVGVVLSLLHSHISQFNTDCPQMIWSRVVEIVQSHNQTAGTITREKLPEDLKEAFRKKEEKIPDELFVPKMPISDKSLIKDANAPALVFANLLGKWDENNEADLDIIKRLSDGF